MTAWDDFVKEVKAINVIIHWTIEASTELGGAGFQDSFLFLSIPLYCSFFLLFLSRRPRQYSMRLIISRSKPRSTG